MKRSVGIWELWGFAVVSILGTLLHFMYEWLGEPAWIAAFSGVNESTWEHMKLLYWPMLVYAVFQSFFFREVENFWCVKLRGMLLGLVSIPILFYTYNGVIGESPDWINIAIFFVSAAIVYLYEAWQLKRDSMPFINSKVAIMIICLVGLLFVVFTFKTPSLAIFEDPLTGKFGISG